jgi:H+/Cl- antiporter ClcA
VITIIVVVVFLVILAADLLPKWKNTGKKEKFFYIALMIISFGVLVLYTFDVKIPSPTKPITKLIDSLFPALNK